MPYVIVFLVFVLFPVGYGLWLARSPASYAKLFEDPIFFRTAINTIVFLVVAINIKMMIALYLSGFFLHTRWWIKVLAVLFILPWAVPSIPTILSVRFMLNPEWGVINSTIFRLTGLDGPNWLNDPTLALSLSMLMHIWKSLPFWTLILLAGRMAIPGEQYEAASVDGASNWQKFRYITWPSMKRAVPHVDAAVDDLDAGRLQQRLSAHRRRPGRPDPCAGHAGHPLPAPGPDRTGDGFDRREPAAGAADRLLHDEAAEQMKLKWRDVTTEAKLLLVGIPVLLWTIIPVYHMFLFAISERDQATSGRLWPKNPTLQNFEMVFQQQHFYLNHFWVQLGNSLWIAVAVGVITLFIATTAAFAISRLKVPGGRTVMNLALFTYFIPAAFLAVPMYKTMATYGLLNNRWSLVLAMVTIASPYCIWVLKQASDKLPWELDEAARIDGATPLQLFRLVYLPLMVPSLVAVGTYALLLAWNEYLYGFLLLSNEQHLTLAVALGNFLAADDSPWELLMATGFIYALPPAAIYYAFKRYMVSGLTAGAVKS